MTNLEADVKSDRGPGLAQESIDGHWPISDRSTDESFADDAGESIGEKSRGAAGSHDAGVDRGLMRAGSAAAARRRELDISQRSLATEGIINAGALIAFEKGRSWPRESTRAKLEKVLRWPAGAIARLRHEGSVPGSGVTQAPPRHEQHEPYEQDEPLIVQAVAAAVESCKLAVDALPAANDPEFAGRLASILADLRQLGAVAAQATGICGFTPALVKALSTVRRKYDDLMLLAAAGPDAALGPRLYAARRRANLSILETAQAAGVAEEMITRVEADESVPAVTADAIEALISTINLA